MADVSGIGIGIGSRSQVMGCDTAHLEAAAAGWSATATQWEEHFTTIHTGTLSPGGGRWDGAGADAAQDGTFADLVTVRGLADHLQAAAAAARAGADDIAWVKSQAVAAISDAEQVGFSVGDDLSVTDRYSSPLMGGGAGVARQAQAELFAADIGARAQNLCATDTAVAAKISSALAPLQDVSFGGDPAVQAASFRMPLPQDVQDGDEDPFTGAHTHEPQPKYPMPTPFDPETGAAQGGGGEAGAGDGELPVGAGDVAPGVPPGWPSRVADNGKGRIYQAWKQSGHAHPAKT